MSDRSSSVLPDPPRSSVGSAQGLAGQADVPAVSVRDLRKSFGTLEVLKGLSLQARTGDVISILGASGSG